MNGIEPQTGSRQDCLKRGRGKGMTQKWNIEAIADDVLREIVEAAEGDMDEVEAQVESNLPDYLNPFLDGPRSRGVVNPLDEAVIVDAVTKYIGKIPDLQSYLREHLPDCFGTKGTPQDSG